MLKASRFSVLLAGLCSLAVCMGLGRYAFTPMIPVMSEQAGITESTAGWLAGWGYIGYLTGLFVVWLISSNRVKDFFFRYALIVTVLATALMAANEHPLVWGASRFFAGVGAATGFLFGAGLIVNWLHRNGHSIRMGIYFCGLGLGIALSAITVEILNTQIGMHYRWMWVAMAGCGIVPLLLALVLLPLPRADDDQTDAVAVDQSIEEPSVLWLWLMQGAYFCAGFSNTMNGTFTSLIAELQAMPGFGTKAWLVVGIAATPAPLIWEAVARRISYLDALLVAFLLSAIGNLVLVNVPTVTGTLVAAVIFGFSFMGIVSLTLATVSRRYVRSASQIMAQLTLGYCIAQILAPIVSGVVAEQTGSFELPVAGVTLMMVVGAVLLWLVRREDVYRRDKSLFSHPTLAS